MGGWLNVGAAAAVLWRGFSTVGQVSRREAPTPPTDFSLTRSGEQQGATTTGNLNNITIPAEDRSTTGARVLAPVVSRKLHLEPFALSF